MDLLQNCDLPPPLKLFSPFEKADDKIRTIPKVAPWDAETEAANQAENTSLLRALQLSQSRAREAEKKAAAARKDSDQMTSLILEESLRLSAHRQWVKLLEVELLLIHERKKMNKEELLHEDDGPTLRWCLTVALCLGIGFALGRCIL